MGTRSLIQLFPSRCELASAPSAEETEGRAANPEYGPLCNCALTQRIEIALEPLGLEVAEGANAQIHEKDPRHTLGVGVSENDIEDALGHGEFMHVEKIRCEGAERKGLKRWGYSAVISITVH
jgi:hypothetical protein